MRMLRAGLVLVLAAACAACLEVTQEVWVNADGSGRLQMDIAVAEALMAMAQESEDGGSLQATLASYDKLKADPGRIGNLRSIDHREYTEGGLHHFVIEVEVDDVTLLPETLDEISRLSAADGEPLKESDELATPSDMRFERLDDGRLLFVQSLVTEDAQAAGKEQANDEELDEASRAFLSSMFAGKYYVIRLHAPAVNSANGQLAEDGGSVQWKIPMVDLMGGDAPGELRAEIEVERG
jgi:hypothetical protein